ncbi:MAG: hypothetical protein J2P37_30525 [Ktedonobacteraceae bacterium]|nr:hypothetical protein [Ktedonobacteraceae bacterium]
MSTKAVEAEQPKELLKLDLGCGENKREGFIGIDLYAKADQTVDLFKFPWPWTDESVEEVYCSHFFEHIPGPARIPWMDELWRILVPEGKATIIVPYWSSPRAIQDPMHAWPPVAESSFLYFNKGWREANKLNHYLGRCDFDFSYGYLLDPETAMKNQELVTFYVKHYTQSVNDLQVNLVKRNESDNGNVR